MSLLLIIAIVLMLFIIAILLISLIAYRPTTRHIGYNLSTGCMFGKITRLLCYILYLILCMFGLMFLFTSVMLYRTNTV